MTEKFTHIPFRLGGQLLNLLLVALGIAAAYFMTIQSLKLELAAKAEHAVVETLDKKLINIIGGNGGIFTDLSDLSTRQNTFAVICLIPLCGIMY